MSLLEAIGEGIDPINHVVPRIEDRGDKNRRQRPFPPVPKEEEEDSPPDEPETPPERAPDEGTDDHQVDLIVRGQILPSRQFLPSNPQPERLH